MVDGWWPVVSYVEIPSPHLCDACASRPLTTARRHADRGVAIRHGSHPQAATAHRFGDDGPQTRSGLQHSLAPLSCGAVSQADLGGPLPASTCRSLTPRLYNRRSGEAADSWNAWMPWDAFGCREMPWSRSRSRHPHRRGQPNQTTPGDRGTRLPSGRPKTASPRLSFTARLNNGLASKPLLPWSALGCAGVPWSAFGPAFYNRQLAGKFPIDSQLPSAKPWLTTRTKAYRVSVHWLVQPGLPQLLTSSSHFPSPATRARLTMSIIYSTIGMAAKPLLLRTPRTPRMPECPGPDLDIESRFWSRSVTLDPVLPVASHLYRCRRHLYRCHASIRWCNSTRLTHRTTYRCVHRSRASGSDRRSHGFPRSRAPPHHLEARTLNSTDRPIDLPSIRSTDHAQSAHT